MCKKHGAVEAVNFPLIKAKKDSRTEYNTVSPKHTNIRNRCSYGIRFPRLAGSVSSVSSVVIGTFPNVLARKGPGFCASESCSASLWCERSMFYSMFIGGVDLEETSTCSMLHGKLYSILHKNPNAISFFLTSSDSLVVREK